MAKFIEVEYFGRNGNEEVVRFTTTINVKNIVTATKVSGMVIDASTTIPMDGVRFGLVNGGSLVGICKYEDVKSAMINDDELIVSLVKTN